MPEKDEDREKKEYEALLVIFERFINSIDSEMEYWEIMEELMALRADFAIQHAIEGFGMDWEAALEIIRTSDISGLSDEDQNRREVLLAAIDNLVDFAVAEEYRMTLDMEEEIEDAEGDEEELEIAMKVFKKYNSQYANVENSDIKYAMMVAAGIIFIPKSTSLMYMTQGDERVRPWHLQFEGFTAPKSDFPGWLIPPIEHQCRCYLVADGEVSGKMQDIQNAISIPEIPDWFNPTFKESVAFGGRIFSDEHPYFQIEEADIDKLQHIAESIKGKYLNG